MRCSKGNTNQTTGTDRILASTIQSKVRLLSRCLAFRYTAATANSTSSVKNRAGKNSSSWKGLMNS